MDAHLTASFCGEQGATHLHRLWQETANLCSRLTLVGNDVYCRTPEPISFDRELGRCAAGDTIYVCVGPDETDYHDSFGIDFAIGRF